LADLVQLAFAAATAVLLLVFSRFDHTTHFVEGNRNVFAYSWVGLLFVLSFCLIPLAAAWFCWRVMKVRLFAAIFLLGIPLIGVSVLPQIMMERVEVSPTQLIHRREPPHNRYDADIEFDTIASAVETQQCGYIFVLKNGQIVELPGNTILTTAHDTIDARLRARNIPIRAN
jgi:hypothetical protein